MSHFNGPLRKCQQNPRYYQHHRQCHLSHASGTLYLEWLSAINGNTIEKSLALGGQKHEFTPPFDGEAVLYIYKQQKQ